VVRAFLFFLFVTAATGQEPLPKAHAHNDYEHERPLWDALAHGFCGVEADIYLVDGRLLVAHDREDLKPERTLQALYLEPLRKRVTENEGHVHRGKKMKFTLLIDIKSDGEATYRTLSKVLARYREILTETKDGKTTHRAVTAVISGNRAKETIAAGNPRFAGIDGRLGDLESKDPGDLLPLISDRWSSHFDWNGQGEMPADQRQKLHEIVKKAHASDRRVRFWATPEKVSVWRELQAAGVDLINTDDLAGLQKFLTVTRQ
jgi:glycerophosphoryl diester phosphodiesterase